MLIINIIFTLIIFSATLFSLLKKEKVLSLNEEDMTGVSFEGLKKIFEVDIFKREYFWIIILSLIALTRLILYPQIPGGINQDGAMSGVDAKALADYATDRFGTHMPSHLYAWGYGQMSSLLAYMESFLIKIFGLNKFTLRFPLMLMSFLGLLACYIVGRCLYGKIAAYLFGFFAAINPWQFMQSRWALDCNLFPHFFLIAFALMLMAFKYSRKWLLYLSMVFYGLCMYTYGVSFYFMPLFLLAVSMYLLLYRFIKLKDLLICIVIYFLIAWPEYGVMLINFMRWDTVKLPFVTMQFFSESIRSSDILFFSDDIIKQLGLNFKSLLNVVFLQKKDLIWNDIEGFGTIYKPSMLLMGLGLCVSLYYSFSISAKNIRRQYRKMVFSLINIYFVFAILLGLMINGINVNRCNIVYYAEIMYMGIGLYFIYERIKSAAFGVIMVYFALFVLFLTNYFGPYKEMINDAFYGDFVEAITCAREYDCDYYIITPDTQYEGARQVTSILVDFVFENDAEYMQGIKEERIPYSEKFRYWNLSYGDEPYHDCCYVFKIQSDNDYDETLMYPGEFFKVVDFGKYGVAIPKKYVID